MMEAHNVIFVLFLSMFKYTKEKFKLCITDIGKNPNCYKNNKGGFCFYCKDSY